MGYSQPQQEGFDSTIRPSYTGATGILHEEAREGGLSSTIPAPVSAGGFDGGFSRSGSSGITSTPVPESPSKADIGLNNTTRAGLAMGGGLGSTIRPSFSSGAAPVTFVEEQEVQAEIPEVTSLAALAAARGFGAPLDATPEPPYREPEPILQSQSAAVPGGLGSPHVGGTAAATSGGFVQGGGLGSTTRPPGSGLRTLAPGAEDPPQASVEPASAVVAASPPGTITFGMLEEYGSILTGRYYEKNGWMG